MMKKTKFLCILSICFIFLQCKKDKLNPNVDAEFQPYFQQFFEDLENFRPSLDKNYLDYSIQFDDSISIGPQIGICSEIGGFDITISRASWEKMDEVLREMLIYHELGHCVLGRNHNNLTFQGNNAESWMGVAAEFPRSGVDVYSEEWRDFYRKEMFGADDGLAPAWVRIAPYFDIASKATDTVLVSTDTNFEYRPSANSNFQVEYFLTKKDSLDIQLGKYFIKYKHVYYIDNAEYTGRIDYFYDGQRTLFNNEMVIAQEVEKPLTLMLRKRGDYIYFYVENELWHTREYVAEDKLDVSIVCDSAKFDGIRIIEWE